MFHRVDGRCAPQDPTKDEARSSGDPPRRNRGPTRRVCARRSRHLAVPSTHSGWPTEVKGECQHPVGRARKRALDFPSTRSIRCLTGRNAWLACPKGHCSAAARLSPASPLQIMCTQCQIPDFVESQIL